MHAMRRLFLSLFLLAGPASLISAKEPRPGPNSFLVKGGTIVDGTGTPARKGEVRVREGRIAALGVLKPEAGETVIDATGKVVAPGFIDIHNHSEESLLEDPLVAGQISQGITTLAVGPDGGSPWPVRTYLETLQRSPAALNVAAFVGHGTIRSLVIGNDFKRESTPDEIRRMVELTDTAMKEGAIGLSSGLEYDPGFYASTAEVVAMARAVRKYGGIYMSHMRDEADRVVEAVQELIDICRQAKVPGQISHIKLGTVGVWGKTSQVVSMVDSARRKGIDITADCYPYDAWHSGLSVLVPSRRFDDPEAVRKGLADVGGADRVTIIRCGAFPDYLFKTLARIAADEGSDPVAVYVKVMKSGGAGIVCRSMTEEDVRAFYRTPWVMVASDGSDGNRHPRGAGTFPRVLGLFARDEKTITLEEAVKKCSAMPAARMRLRDRGLLRKGMQADIVIFDPMRVRDRSTFAEPLTLSEGIEEVFVNGIRVWRQGKPTGARPGMVIRGNRRRG
jgi:N-acyl-D-amino-acid deacylase